MEKKKIEDIIGTYCLTNAIGVAVYEFDYYTDKVLAGWNGEQPEWRDVVENWKGFMMDNFFIPFDEVMRV